MSSWATLTLKIREPEKYGEKEAPIGLLLDSGIDEQGWVGENTYYALSFGRYQEEALRRHLEEFHSPMYTGITTGILASMEDTGDSIESETYIPKQIWSEERVDGFEKIQEHSGSRWPDEEREEFRDEIEALTELRPVIEPQENTVPLDMMVSM
jgi:hypothetical protein